MCPAEDLTTRGPESTFLPPSSFPTAPQRGNALVYTDSSDDELPGADTTERNTTTRTAGRSRLYLSLTPCTLLCTVPWVSANNVVVKQSPRRDPPRLRTRDFHARAAPRRTGEDVRTLVTIVYAYRQADAPRELMAARELYEINPISSSRSPWESSSSDHGEAVISRRRPSSLAGKKNTRYVTLTFHPVILHPVSKVTITPMYNSYLDNNVARSCDLYGAACFLVFAFNYARNAVLHCIRLFAR